MVNHIGRTAAGGGDEQRVSSGVKMRVDPKKVNLAEKDVEDWLWENPGALSAVLHGYDIERWIARQYSLPSGIIDLLGVARHDTFKTICPVVVEIKNQPLTSAAVAQVCRYAADVAAVIEEINAAHKWPFDTPFYQYTSKVVKVLVAPEPVENQVLFEAEAMSVPIHIFSVNFELTLHGRTSWTHEAIDRYGRRYVEAARDGTFDDFAMLARRLREANERAEKEHAEEEQIQGLIGTDEDEVVT